MQTQDSSNTNATTNPAPVFVVALESSAPGGQAMREQAADLLTKVGPGVVILGHRGEAGVRFIVRTSKELEARVPAGQVVKQIMTLIDGAGGGTPSHAEGRGPQTDHLTGVLAAGVQAVKQLLGDDKGIMMSDALPGGEGGKA